MSTSVPRRIYRQYLKETAVGAAVRFAYSAPRTVPAAVKQSWSGFKTRSALVRRLGRARHRANYVALYLWPRVSHGLRWLVTSREITNFTYDITDRNKLHIAHAIALTTDADVEAARAYMVELERDAELPRIIAERVRTSRDRESADETMGYGRRFAWYAMVRAIKPRIVVETGVEKGLGSVLLCAALLRNTAEGFPGRYYGTDWDRNAGFLLAPPYSDVGEVLYGDSLESLARFPHAIDLFINDSDHAPEYERREYAAIAAKLSPRAVILGDNAHETDELARFAEATGRTFLFVHEEPKEHWFPGAGVGIAFR